MAMIGTWLRLVTFDGKLYISVALVYRWTPGICIDITARIVAELFIHPVKAHYHMKLTLA